MLRVKNNVNKHLRGYSSRIIDFTMRDSLLYDICPIEF